MLHKNLTGAEAVHPAAYVQSTDPGAAGAKKFWVDTSALPAEPARLYVRNDTNTGWNEVGSVGAAEALRAEHLHRAGAVYVVSGGQKPAVPAPASFNVTFPALTAYLGGNYVEIAGFTHTFAPNTSTSLDYDADGNMTVKQSALPGPDPPWPDEVTEWRVWSAYTDANGVTDIYADGLYEFEYLTANRLGGLAYGRLYEITYDVLSNVTGISYESLLLAMSDKGLYYRVAGPDNAPEFARIGPGPEIRSNDLAYNGHESLTWVREDENPMGVYMFVNGVKRFVGYLDADNRWSGGYDIENKAGLNPLTEAGNALHISDEFESQTLHAQWTLDSGSMGTVSFLGDPAGPIFDLATRAGSLLIQPKKGGPYPEISTAGRVSSGESIVLSFSVPHPGPVANNALQISVRFGISGGGGTSYRNFLLDGTDAGIKVQDFSNTVLAHHDFVKPYGTRLYLRVSRSGGRIYYMWSLDGSAWSHLYNEAEFATEQDRMWISVIDEDTAANTPAPVVALNWVRHVASVALDPW